MKYGPEKWDKRFGVDDYVYGKNPNLFLKENFKKIPTGNVLCIADGEGRNGVWLAKNKYNGIVSIYTHFKIDEINKLHAKYFNALKQNGVLFMEVFAKEQLKLKTGGPKDISLLFDIQDIQKSFPNGKIELLKKDVVYSHECHIHDGKAVVVRAIIRKPSDKEN